MEGTLAHSVNQRFLAFRSYILCITLSGVSTSQTPNSQKLRVEFVTPPEVVKWSTEVDIGSEVEITDAQVLLNEETGLLQPFVLLRGRLQPQATSTSEVRVGICGIPCSSNDSWIFHWIETSDRGVDAKDKVVSEQILGGPVYCAVVKKAQTAQVENGLFCAVWTPTSGLSTLIRLGPLPPSNLSVLSISKNDVTGNYTILCKAELKNQQSILRNFEISQEHKVTRTPLPKNTVLDGSDISTWIGVETSLEDHEAWLGTMDGQIKAFSLQKEAVSVLWMANVGTTVNSLVKANLDFDAVYCVAQVQSGTVFVLREGSIVKGFENIIGPPIVHDFLKTGYHQILLPTTSSSRMEIVDLCQEFSSACVDKLMQKEGMQKVPDANENLSAVLNSLTARIYAGDARIREFESNITRKYNMRNRTQKLLRDTASMISLTTRYVPELSLPALPTLPRNMVSLLHGDIREDVENPPPDISIGKEGGGAFIQLVDPSCGWVDKNRKRLWLLVKVRNTGSERIRNISFLAFLHPSVVPVNTTVSLIRGSLFPKQSTVLSGTMDIPLGGNEKNVFMLVRWLDDHGRNHEAATRCNSSRTLSDLLFENAKNSKVLDPTLPTSGIFVSRLDLDVSEELEKGVLAHLPFTQLVPSLLRALEDSAVIEGGEGGETIIVRSGFNDIFLQLDRVSADVHRLVILAVTDRAAIHTLQSILKELPYQFSLSLAQPLSTPRGQRLRFDVARILRSRVYEKAGDHDIGRRRAALVISDWKDLNSSFVDLKR